MKRFLLCLWPVCAVMAQTPQAPPAPQAAPPAPAAPAATVAPAKPVPAPNGTPAAPVPAGTPGTPAATATPAASPTPTPAGPVAKPKPLPPEAVVEALSDADTRQALDLIRANYLNAGALSEDALNRATLQGLLERLGPGIAIEGEVVSNPAEEPLRAEILDDRVGYVRLGSLSKDRLAEFEAALGNFVEKKIGAVILDLRSTPANNDFALAADLIRKFTPKGKMLFAVRRPNAKQEQIFTSSADPAFHGVVVTVVNRNTAGAGEVIAAVLRVVCNALVVGEPTAGEAAEFSTASLRGGRLLRVAVGEVKLPGELNIFPKGLKPDVTVEVSPQREAQALRLGLERGVSGLVFERERARRNEAALVAGIDPELDEALAAQKRGDERNARPVSDPALQRAVDLVTTITIFSREQAKRP